MHIRSHQFQICYRKYTSLILDCPDNYEGFVLIKNPLFYWCADPFPFHYKGKDYIFAELATKYSQKGKIGFICLSEKHPRWRICLKEKFHLSFPNILILNGKPTIIPESNQNKSVLIYSAKNFPFEWSIQKKLLDNVIYVDTCFLDKKINDFYTYDISDPKLYHLLQYRNLRLIGKIEDKNSCLRPAGNLFLHGNDIIFPSQENSLIYGGNIIFNKIKDLKIEQMFKLDLNEINKSLHVNDVVGCHTYNFNEFIEVIDIVRLKFSLLRLFWKIKSKLFKKK